MSERYTLKDLLAIMARLRGADGCPWDREQTFESLKQYLIEECYEVIDAIDSGQPDRHAEELGDLLLQVVFQAQIAREQNRFDFDDVIGHICAKLIRRHPHVFGEASVAGTAEVLKNWEAIKAREKQAAGRHPRGAGRPAVRDGQPEPVPGAERRGRPARRH